MKQTRNETIRQLLSGAPIENPHDIYTDIIVLTQKTILGAGFDTYLLINDEQRRVSWHRHVQRALDAHFATMRETTQ